MKREYQDNKFIVIKTNIWKLATGDWELKENWQLVAGDW
jgi:hypothetical protein